MFIKLLVCFSSYASVILLGHVLVKAFLRKYQLSRATGLKGAGAIIGILERILTLTFVLLNEYTALALVFTAKSIARFEELKNRDFAEYYLVGTLSSIFFAILMGIVTKWVFSLLQI